MKKQISIVAAIALVSGGLFAHNGHQHTSIKNEPKREIQREHSEFKMKKTDPADCVLESYEQSGIGDVKYSVLSEADFQKVHGDEWVRLGGQTINGMTFPGYETGAETIQDVIDVGGPYADSNKLPDARGRFLRSRDHTAGADPEGNLDIGTLQGFETALPSNESGSGFSITGGAHTHNLTEEYMRFVGSAPGDIDGNSTRDWIRDTRTITTHSGGSHTHSIGGGNHETAPRHVIVNAFVKVRRACINTTITDSLRSAFCGPNDMDAHPEGCFGMSESALNDQRDKVACLQEALNDWVNETGLGKNWSRGCLMQVVGTSKKILMDMGASKLPSEVDFFNQLVVEYPYFNAIESSVQ